MSAANGEYPPVSGSAADRMTVELIRDDKHIVLVTPEAKRQMEAAQEWYDRVFTPAFERQNARLDRQEEA